MLAPKRPVRFPITTVRFNSNPQAAIATNSGDLPIATHFFGPANSRHARLFVFHQVWQAGERWLVGGRCGREHGDAGLSA